MSPPQLEEKPIPLWLKVTAIGYVVVAAVSIWAFWGRLHADFIPLDGSRVAPNILASALIVIATTPIAVLVWPPTRRRIHRCMTRHTAPLHDEFAEVHRKLDHVILHSKDVPPLPPS